VKNSLSVSLVLAVLCIGRVSLAGPADFTPRDFAGMCARQLTHIQKNGLDVAMKFRATSALNAAASKEIEIKFQLSFPLMGKCQVRERTYFPSGGNSFGYFRIPLGKEVSVLLDGKQYPLIISTEGYYTGSENGYWRFDSVTLYQLLIHSKAMEGILATDGFHGFAWHESTSGYGTLATVGGTRVPTGELPDDWRFFGSASTKDGDVYGLSTNGMRFP